MLDKKNSDKTFFGPKLFWTKNFCLDQKLFLGQKLFLDQKIFGRIFFFLVKIFSTKFFFRPKIFFTKNFGSQKMWVSKIFPSKKNLGGGQFLLGQIPSVSVFIKVKSTPIPWPRLLGLTMV